jgi:hypothetical protein
MISPSYGYRSRGSASLIPRGTLSTPNIKTMIEWAKGSSSQNTRSMQLQIEPLLFFTQDKLIFVQHDRSQFICEEGSEALGHGHGHGHGYGRGGACDGGASCLPPCQVTPTQHRHDATYHLPVRLSMCPPNTKSTIAGNHRGCCLA